VTVPRRTVDELLALWRDVVAEGYSAPIEAADAAGYDIIQAFADIFSDVDLHNMTASEAYYLKPDSDQLAPPASGGVPASGELLLTRIGSAEGEMTLLEGTQFEGTITDSLGITRGQGRFELSESVVFADGEPGPKSVPGRSTEPGYDGNLPAESIVTFPAASSASISQGALVTADTVRDDPAQLGDRFNESMVGRFVTLDNFVAADLFPRRILEVRSGPGQSMEAVLATAFPAAVPLATPFDFTVRTFSELFTVSQPAAFSGGTTAILDAIGDERRARRQLFEKDAEYRERVCEVSDVVSPNAIKRIVERILGPHGCNWKLIETLDPLTLTGLTYDYPIPGPPAVPPYPAPLWAAYDTEDLECNGAVYAPPTRYFAILVERCSIDDWTLWYDAAPSPKPNAYDADASAPYDGDDWAFNTLMAALYNQVNSAKAGGVAWDLILVDSIC